MDQLNLIFNEEILLHLKSTKFEFDLTKKNIEHIDKNDKFVTLDKNASKVSNYPRPVQKFVEIK